MANKNNLNGKFEYKNGTLRNKLNIKDYDVLASIEYAQSCMISNQILKEHPKITNIAQLNVIHKHMFSPFFSWAGTPRTYQSQKKKFQGHNDIKSWFDPTNYFPNSIKYINSLIIKANDKDKPTSYDYAVLLDNINYLHPFKDGNGRSTKVFLQCLALNHGQRLEYDKDEKPVIYDLNRSYKRDLAKHLKVTNLSSKRESTPDEEPLYIKDAYLIRGKNMPFVSAAFARRRDVKHNPSINTYVSNYRTHDKKHIYHNQIMTITEFNHILCHSSNPNNISIGKHQITHWNTSNNIIKIVKPNDKIAFRAQVVPDLNNYGSNRLVVTDSAEHPRMMLNYSKQIKLERKASHNHHKRNSIVNHDKPNDINKFKDKSKDDGWEF